MAPISTPASTATQKRRLTPLDTRDPTVKKKLPPRKALSTVVRRGLELARTVTDQALAAYKPSHDAHLVAEAVLAGLASAQAIAEWTDLGERRAREVLADPLAMAWISRTTHEHFRHRAALVDAALYARACQGDVAAIRLYYERSRLLDNEQRIHVQYSGGVDVRALSDDDLRRLISDKQKILPAEFTVVEPKGETKP